MRNTVYGLMFWAVLIGGTLGGLWHLRQPIKAPIAGIGETISQEEYHARNLLEMEFSPETASIGLEANGQVYLKLGYLKGLWTQKVYLKERFCTGVPCARSEENALIKQLKDGGPIKVIRVNVTWNKGVYKNAGFWQLPYEK